MIAYCFDRLYDYYSKPGMFKGSPYRFSLVHVTPKNAPRSISNPASTQENDLFSTIVYGGLDSKLLDRAEILYFSAIPVLSRAPGEIPELVPTADFPRWVPSPTQSGVESDRRH